MSDIVKVLRDLCDNNYNDNFEKVLNDLLDYYDHDNTGVVKALDSINESISLEALDAMEAAIEEIKKLRAELNRMRSALDKAGQFIADEYADPRVEPDGEWLAREARPIYAAICEALEGREWERFRNEKVAVGAGSQIIGKGADQFIIDDPFRPPTDPAQWQLIETAPTDGTLICGAWMYGSSRWATKSLFWNGHNWECPDSILDGYFGPTHWMPLPPPEANE